MAERVFRSIEEVRRVLLPDSCPACGSRDSRQDFTQILNGRSRVCSRCGRPWTQPEPEGEN
jgi:hypothetical protein